MQTQSIGTKDAKRRERILHGNLWKTMIVLTAPLALYNLFNFLYGFIDMLMVKDLGANHLSSVIFIDEIKSAISAFGGALAAAGSVIVARAYGAGKMEEARKNAGTTFIVSLLVSIAVVVITVGFGRFILMGVGATQEIIDTGLSYYNIQMVSTALIAVNGVFIGLEKAKGNTSVVLILNLIVMAIKLGLSALFIYGFQGDLTSLALATLIAQGVLTIVALFIMFKSTNIFRIRLIDFKLEGQYVKQLLILSLPLFIGKFLFNIGKVSINSLALKYGTYAVSALGVAMKIYGPFSAVITMFEETEMSVVSQNLGNKRLDRAISTFKITMILTIGLGLVGLGLSYLTKDLIIDMFASTEQQKQMINQMYVWEQFSQVTSPTLGVISGLFLGFKKTKISMVLNLIRIFIFRLPVLWVFTQVFPTGIDTAWFVGFTMFISNTSTLLVAWFVGFLFLKRVIQMGYEDMHVTQYKLDLNKKEL